MLGIWKDNKSFQTFCYRLWAKLSSPNLL